MYRSFYKKTHKKRSIVLGIVLFFLATLFFTMLHITRTQATTKHLTRYVENELIVMFQEGTEYEKMTQLVTTLAPTATIAEYEDNYMLLSFQKGCNPLHIAPKFLSSSIVTSAEPNYMITSTALTKDTYTNSQWALYNDGEYRSYSNLSSHLVPSTKGVDLNVAYAYRMYNKQLSATREVIVAILDTGVDISHADLKDNIWRNNDEIPGDGIDNDGNHYIDDINGWDFYNNDNTLCHYIKDPITKTKEADPDDMDDHGTHCAGIIGAVANNRQGIAGVASNVNIKLMPLKIQGGNQGTGTISNTIKAIKYATRMGANICNMSWGCEVYSSSLEQAMRESNMLFITAAGNSGTDNNLYPVYPASFELPNMISVTFIDSDGDLCLLSNYGGRSVDIAAPGEDILSTMVGNTYGVMSGSSMAVPHVSGIAAMIYAYSNSLYPANVKDLILNNVTYLPQLDETLVVPGIPNALYAIQDLASLKSDTMAPKIRCKTSYKKEKLVVTVTAKDTGKSKLRVLKYMPGKKSLAAFSNGTRGTSITKQTITLLKAGTYTFYASDYSGNETSYIYKVKDDTTPPVIDASYSISNNYKTKTIRMNITDKQSKVKTVKYAKGKKTLRYFKSGSKGNLVKRTKKQYAIKVPSTGVYTIYSVDYRGNKSIQYITVSIRKATNIKLSSSKRTMEDGDSYTLEPVITPSNSTDQVTYQSSNPKVVTVSRTGKLTAKHTGRAIITAKTSSGKKTTITITVLTSQPPT